MDGHPDARCFLEPFHESGAHLGIFRRDDPLTQKIHLGDIVKLREADTEAYLRFLETVGDGRYISTLGGGRNEIGFKILRGQDPAAMDFVVACRTIKKIVLRRENVLAAYLSLERALQTKQWNLKVDEEQEFAAPVTFHAAEFAEFRQIYDEFYEGVIARLEATGQRCLPVKNIALHDLATLNACAAFLDLPPVAALP